MTGKLPALTGSETQTAWADDLRARTIADVDHRKALIIDSIDGDPGRAAQAEKANAALDQALAALIAQWTTARAWIDYATQGRDFGARDKTSAIQQVLDDAQTTLTRA